MDDWLVWGWNRVGCEYDVDTISHRDNTSIQKPVRNLKVR